MDTKLTIESHVPLTISSVYISKTKTQNTYKK